MASSDSSIILYQSPDGNTILDVQLDQETVWLNQRKWLHCSTGISLLSLVTFAECLP